MTKYRLGWFFQPNYNHGRVGIASAYNYLIINRDGGFFGIFRGNL